MKYLASLILAILLVISTGGPAVTAANPPIKIPTFSIVKVIADQSVTIQTYDFPANDTFEVLMGKIGTRGVKGTRIATTPSGQGGSFQATYTIPAALKGDSQIAIRLQSTTGSGYFAYNWFYNSSIAVQPGPEPGKGYSGYPTFSILRVVQDQSVTVQTKNLPPNDSFDVLMGPMGTQGIKGTKAATTGSGAGGAQTLTYNIPAGLKGSRQIAIRMQSNTGTGYFAYNWFYNSTTGASNDPSPTPQPGSGYTGYPTFSIASVVRDQSVTIQAKNLPPNDSLDVLMGPMGTKGVKGTKITTTQTGNGGAQSFTYEIPAGLKGSYQIAIRLQSNTGSGYFAYNWFYNSTAP